MATKERLIIESMLMIADKDGNDVPFKLNPAQIAIDSALTRKNAIPKARQRGVSTYFLARGLVKCISRRNTSAVVISHDTKSTQKMLEKVHYMIDNMLGAKPVISTSNKNEIGFPKMGSKFYIGTAGSRKFGRGDTINFLHCSEVAFWDKPKELLSGLFQAVPKSGEISLESTGNGKGNYYHRVVVRAANGESAYRLHFLPWHTDPEYRYDISKAEAEKILNNLIADYDEHILVEQGITAGQLAWRREKIEELDFDLTEFKQEYPMTLDECFQSTGSSLFGKVNYEISSEWINLGDHTWGFKQHPIPGRKYAIGADVAGGLGGRSSEKNQKGMGEGDRSVIQVICIDTMEQVAEYANNDIMPDTFGNKVAEFGERYNYAYVNVENNNHGIVTLKVLKDIYPHYLISKSAKGRKGAREEVDKITDFGFRTTVKSKPFMIGELRKSLRDEVVIHSPLLKDELDSFIEDANGQLGAEEGCFDDRVVALAVVMVTMDKAIVMTADDTIYVPSENQDPFTLDAIIKEMHSRREDFPISSQVATDLEEYNLESFNFI